MSRFLKQVVFVFIVVSQVNAQVEPEILFDPLFSDSKISIFNEELELLEYVLKGKGYGVMNYSGEVILQPSCYDLHFDSQSDRIACDNSEGRKILNLKGKDITSKKNLKLFDEYLKAEKARIEEDKIFNLEKLHPQIKIEKTSDGYEMHNREGGLITSIKKGHFFAKMQSENVLYYKSNGGKYYNFETNSPSPKKIRLSDTTYVLEKRHMFVQYNIKNEDVPIDTFQEIQQYDNNKLLVLTKSAYQKYLAEFSGQIIGSQHFIEINFYENFAFCKNENWTYKVFDCVLRDFIETEWQIVDHIKDSPYCKVKSSSNEIGVINIQDGSVVIPLMYNRVYYRNGYFLGIKNKENLLSLLGGDVFNSEFEKIISDSKYSNAVAIDEYLHLGSEKKNVIVDNRGEVLRDDLPAVHSVRKGVFVQMKFGNRYAYTTLDNYFGDNNPELYFDNIEKEYHSENLDLTFFTAKNDWKRGLFDEFGNLHLDFSFDKISQIPDNKDYFDVTIDRHKSIVKFSKKEVASSNHATPKALVVKQSNQFENIELLNSKIEKLIASDENLEVCSKCQWPKVVFDQTKLIASFIEENSSTYSNEHLLQILFSNELLSKKEYRHLLTVSSKIEESYDVSLSQYVTLFKFKQLLKEESVRQHIVNQVVSFDTSESKELKYYNSKFIDGKMSLTDYLNVTLDLIPLKLSPVIEDNRSIEVNTYEILRQVYGDNIRIRKVRDNLEIMLGSFMTSQYKLPLDFFPNVDCREYPNSRICDLKNPISLEEFLPVIRQFLSQTQADSRHGEELYNIRTYYDFLNINFEVEPILKLFPDLDVLGSQYFINRAYTNLFDQIISLELKPSNEITLEHIYFRSFTQYSGGSDYTVSTSKKKGIAYLILNELVSLGKLTHSEREELRNQILSKPASSEKAVLYNFPGSFVVTSTDLQFAYQRNCAKPLSDIEGLNLALGDDFSLDNFTIVMNEEDPVLMNGEEVLPVKSLNQLCSYINANSKNQEKAIYFVDCEYVFCHYMYIEKAIANKLNEKFAVKLELIK